ncbi:MAG: uroporphyrinogen-III C-methyltransferase [Kiritimatiellia bacterium]
MNLKVGTRGSRLAALQTQGALDRIHALFPDFTFETVKVETPGDRDLKSDLKESPPDFFTRDLDNAVRREDVDFAIHSAKDLPDPVPEDLEWFWLPWREDPRDAWVLAENRSMSDLSESPVIGVSSKRRDMCALRRFHDAVLKPVRGSVMRRLEQLDNGDYDALLMAGAALIRLGLHHRVTEWIELDELCVPPGQGYLAVTFRCGDERLLALRQAFVSAVRFVGAGAGSGDYCTCGGLKDIRSADVCLYDVLMDEALLKHLPEHAERIFVGKRCGEHSLKQNEISRLISVYARQGRRVVRLKGGDPGLFGRLAEETAELDRLDIPYNIRAGVSALTAATSPTGLLLTRRGESRGFCVMTPRAAGGELPGVAGTTRLKLPLVLFMSVRVAPDMARTLLSEGWEPSTPAAVVFNAGADDQRVVSFTLASLHGNPPELHSSAPGLLLIGAAAESLFKKRRGALKGRRILLTCSESIMEKAVRRVVDYGGVPLVRPMIRLEPCDRARSELRNVESYDWVVLTSPAAVKIFMKMLLQSGIDLRSLPRIMTCGPGSAGAFKLYGITPDLSPLMIYSAKGLADILKEVDFKGSRVLRLRSERAGPLLADVLKDKGARVYDEILYRNEFIRYPRIPDFDIVFFASASAVQSFVSQAGTEILKGKYVLAIGKPTADELDDSGIRCDCIPARATVRGAVDALACNCISAEM